MMEFWKDHFNIFHCLKLIEKAWDQVNQQTLCSAWKKLWHLPEPSFEATHNFEAAEADVKEDIISMRMRLGLEADDNVNMLVAWCDAELTTLDQQEVSEVPFEDDATVKFTCRGTEI